MDHIVQTESEGPITDGPGPITDGPGPITDGPGPITDGPGPITDGPVPISDGPGPITDGPVPISDGPGPVDESIISPVKLKNAWKDWHNDANDIKKQMDFLSNFDICDMLEQNIIPSELTNKLNKAFKTFDNDKKIEILNLNTELDKGKYINKILNKILLIGNLGFIIKCKVPNTSTPEAINEYLENLILNTICDFNNDNPVIKIKGILPGSQKLHKDNIHYTINERNDVIRSTLIAIYVKNILNPLTGGKNINIKIKTIKKYKKSKKITRRRRNR